MINLLSTSQKRIVKRMITKVKISEHPSPQRSSGGFCHCCQQEHVLPAGRCMKIATELMKKLDEHGRLDFLESLSPNPLFSTSSLFGDDRGKMFGILEGIDASGNSVVLYAFSGQFNGKWLVPGWAPPLFNEERWQQENFSTEKQIKELTALINSESISCEEKNNLKRQRKLLSQKLMCRLHSLYTVRNFRGEAATLSSFYSSQRGTPTGAGDCCAPKLLNYALNNMIIPTGMAEFYWGRRNLSKSRRHGHFYPACTSKCKPLLGFMLCGLKEQQSSLVPSL